MWEWPGCDIRHLSDHGSQGWFVLSGWLGGCPHPRLVPPVCVTSKAVCSSEEMTFPHKEDYSSIKYVQAAELELEPQNKLSRSWEEDVWTQACFLLSSWDALCCFHTDSKKAWTKRITLNQSSGPNSPFHENPANYNTVSLAIENRLMLTDIGTSSC